MNPKPHFSFLLSSYTRTRQQESMLRDLCRAGVEGMTDLSGSGRYQMYKELVASILAMVLSIAIVAFVGKFLWNNTVAELFTIVRPVRSAWQMVGLLLLMALLR
jgi:hypothetical protein